VLERSAAIVYTQGLGPFDQTGGQDLSLFSSHGLLEFLVDRLSDSNHDGAAIAAWVLAALTGMATVALLVQLPGFGRLRILGMTVFVAGLAAIAFYGILPDAIAGQLWGGDDFEDALYDVVSDAFAVSRRDALVVCGLGIALFATGVSASLIARGLGPQPAAEAEDPER
jgi:hypothetical protein